MEEARMGRNKQIKKKIATRQELIREHEEKSGGNSLRFSR